MSQRNWALAFLTLLVCAGCTTAATTSPESSGRQMAAAKPNVIIILADDLGYEDVTAFGGGRIATPHIDALAADGVRFTNAHVTAAVCAPSRAALLTGRYQQRFGLEFNPGPQRTPAEQARGLPPGEITLAQALRDAGYRTGLIGKWHLGVAPGMRPQERGFESFFGILRGGASYRSPLASDDEAPIGDDKISRTGSPIMRADQVVEETRYLTDALSQEAVAFIDTNKMAPFFLYLAYNAPHQPIEAAKPYLDQVRHIADPLQRAYFAMILALDSGVGELVAKLKAEGLYDNTIIVFTSDNGCAGYVSPKLCGQNLLSGSKGTYLEGGHRVPFVMSWPARIRPQQIDHLTSSLDVFPSILAATGAPHAATQGDGVNLIPALTKADAGWPRETLFFRAGQHLAVIDGRWKLWIAPVLPADSTLGGADARSSTAATPAPSVRFDMPLHVMLFDLQTDPKEQTNIAAAHPEIVARLKGKAQSWSQTLATPLWAPVRVSRFDYDGMAIQSTN